MHTHRHTRSRVLGALAVLVAGAAGLTACASGTTASTSAGTSSAPPAASSSPSHGINPGGPIVSPSPTPPTHTGGSGSSAGAPAKPAHSLPISGYSTQGNVLTVYFYAGVCDKYGVTADQSQSGEVRVAVVVTQHAPTGQMCPMVISAQHASVDLGRPLDGRKVVDAGTNQAVQPQSGSTGGMN